MTGRVIGTAGFRSFCKMSACNVNIPKDKTDMIYFVVTATIVDNIHEYFSNVNK